MLHAERRSALGKQFSGVYVTCILYSLGLRIVQALRPYVRRRGCLPS